MSSDCFVCIVLYCHAYCIVVLIVDDEMSGNQEKSETQIFLSVEENSRFFCVIRFLSDFSVSSDFFVCIVLYCIAMRTVLLY